jgi:hypothetical protein
MLTAAGDDFIFTCKEGSHKALYDFIGGAEPERFAPHSPKRPGPPVPGHARPASPAEGAAWPIG